MTSRDRTEIVSMRAVLKYFIPFVVVASFQYEFAKDGLDYASPFVLMAIRYLLAGIVLVVVSRRFIVNKNIVPIAATTSMSTLFWILGLEYVSPGDSAVLSYTMPLFAIPLAVVVLKEKPSFYEVAGAVVGFSGVVIYSLALVHGSILIGVVLTIINAALWAGFSVLFRRSRNEDPLALVGSQYVLGSIPFFVGAIFYPEVHVVPTFFVDLAYIALLGGALQLTLWNMLLRVEKIPRATTMAFAVPAATVAIQSVGTATLPAETSVLGAALMFLGIYVSSVTAEKKEEARVEKFEARTCDQVRMQIFRGQRQIARSVSGASSIRTRRPLSSSPVGKLERISLERSVPDVRDFMGPEVFERLRRIPSDIHIEI